MELVRLRVRLKELVKVRKWVRVRVRKCIVRILLFFSFYWIINKWYHVIKI